MEQGEWKFMLTLLSTSNIINASNLKKVNILNFDDELYDLIQKHLIIERNLTKVLAVLSNHVTLLIQSLIATKEVKIDLATQCLSCVLDEIKKDPHPMTRKLN